MSAEDWLRPLTDDEIAKLVAHLRAQGADGPCPRCGAAQFQIAGILFLSGRGPGARSLPVAAVSCSKCGDVQTINLIVAGIVPKDPS